MWNWLAFFGGMTVTNLLINMWESNRTDKVLRRVKELERHKDNAHVHVPGMGQHYHYVNGVASGTQLDTSARRVHRDR